MPRRALVMVAVLQMVGLPAGAAEFLPSWDAEGVWSSNVFKSVADEQSDFSIRTGPRLRVREPRGDLTYDVTYQFSYEGYAQIEGLNDIQDADQYFSGRGTWRATPRTRITVLDSFAYTTGLDTLFDDAGLVSTVTIGRERVTTNNAELNFVHDLSPIWQLTASVGNRLFHYENDNQSDTTLTNGTLQITRALNPRLLVGGGSQVQRQEFAEVADIPERGTTVYQAFGVVNYQVSPTLKVMARAGPALVQPDSLLVGDVDLPSYFPVDPSTCPQRADGTPVIRLPALSASDLCGSLAFFSFNGINLEEVQPSTTRSDVPFVGDQNEDNSLNYFGNISISKEWRQWSLTLDYSRSASNSSGLSGSTILDQFTGSVVWEPSERWRVSFDAIYSTQSALNETRQREVALQPGLIGGLFQGVLPVSAIVGVPFEVDSGDTIKSEVELKTTYMTLTASRRISRRLSLIGAATYWQQKSGGLANDATVSDVQFSLGFTWAFDPIPL